MPEQSISGLLPPVRILVSSIGCVCGVEARTTAALSHVICFVAGTLEGSGVGPPRPPEGGAYFLGLTSLDYTAHWPLWLLTLKIVNSRIKRFVPPHVAATLRQGQPSQKDPGQELMDSGPG